MIAATAIQQQQQRHAARHTPAAADPWRWWSAETIAAWTQCPVGAVRAHWPAIHAALAASGGASRESLAGALATIAIETASTFEPVREAYWLSEDWRRDKLRYYPYYGRGYIQLTWPDNYRAAGQALGIDLYAQPDLALEPAHAARIFAWYWTVDRPTLPLASAVRNWREVRRLVQGGADGLERLVRIAEALLAR